MNAERARQALQERGVSFEESRFLRAVRAGDRELVDLFLAAGARPSAKAKNGDSAVVVAARQGHAELARALLAAGADPADLLPAAETKPSRKDFWDKLTSLSGVLTFLSSLVIAGVGWYFTDSYNQRQQKIAQQESEEQVRIAELQTVEKFIPHLVEGDDRKRAALRALQALARPKVWAALAEFAGGSASIETLQQGAQGANGQKGEEAVRSLARIALRAEAAEAGKAREALGRVFAKERSALVRVGTAGDCWGFVLAAREPLVVTAGCVRAQEGVTVETLKQEKIPATPIHLDESAGLALLKLAPEPKVPLSPPLLPAGELPAVGSLLLGLAAGRDDQAEVLPERVDSIDVTVSLSGRQGHLSGSGWISLTVDSEPPLPVGTPVLDATGKAVCIMVAVAAPRAFCVPLKLLKPYP